MLYTNVDLGKKPVSGHHEILRNSAKWNKAYIELGNTWAKIKETSEEARSFSVDRLILHTCHVIYTEDGGQTFIYTMWKDFCVLFTKDAAEEEMKQWE